MKIYFATSNENKVSELAKTLGEHYEVERLAVDLPEVQSLNLHEIIEAKLSHAKELFPDRSLIVEDTSLEIDALGGLPGAFVKFFEQLVDDQGIYEMARGRQPTGKLIGRAKVAIGLIHDDSINFFDGEIEGEVVKQQGEGWGFDRIFIPDGYDKRFGALGMEVKSAISHRTLATAGLKKFLDSVTR